MDNGSNMNYNQNTNANQNPDMNYNQNVNPNANYGQNVNYNQNVNPNANYGRNINYNQNVNPNAEYGQNINYNQNANPNTNYGQNVNYNQNANYGQGANYNYSAAAKPVQNKSGLCTASMVLGIICLATSLFFNLGFLPGVLGFIFAIVCFAKKKQPKGRATAGLITSIIGLIIGFITGVIGILILLFSGLLVGGTISILAALASEFPDNEELINVIDNISSSDYANYWDGSGYDYSDIDWNNTDWSDTDWSNFDWSSLTNDYNTSSLSDLDVKFEDIEDYGYRYEYGDVDYSVYSKNGAEFEFPAYVFDYKDYGDTKYDAYYDYLIDNGFITQTEGFYCEYLYEFDDEWEYATASILAQYDDESVEEVWVFAFSRYSDDMVILICRPNDSHYEDDVNDLIGLMGYMTAK